MPTKPKKPVAKVLSTYELMKKFPNEQSAIDYLEGIRWKDRVQYPYCKGRNITPRKPLPNFYRCNACRKDFGAGIDNCHYLCIFW